MIFYLGSHKVDWFERTGVPLFVSYKRLVGRKSLPRARGRWALDSGAFTEIQTHGRWTIPAAEYAATVRRFMLGIGNMDWAAIQDWMCEPMMLKKTGLTVLEHQKRTVQSLLDLRRIAPDVPWAPVLQGWTTEDYRRHRRMYEAAGVDLRKEKIVGVGSVCRRNLSDEIREIAEENRDLRLHGFGVKMQGVEVANEFFASTDSMAWSFHARRRPPLPGHTTHKNCANCLEYALIWRAGLIARLHEARRAA